MELVPGLPTSFGTSETGVRKRVVGMLALAQSEGLVRDSLIVKERAQQRREAVRARPLAYAYAATRPRRFGAIFASGQIQTQSG